jgi:molybdate transport system substrate-binding protein
MLSRTRVVATIGALALTLPLAACGDDNGGGGSGGGDTTKLQVLAASSLTDVFTDLGHRFEDEHDGVQVEFSFGSSTDLAAQAADGAPGDVLATADQDSMTSAQDAGVVTGDPASFATNVLVLVTPPDNPAHITSLADLDGATWVRCADEAPCGKVALAVLDAQHVTAQPASLEDDARSTLDKVTSGEADAALVYASDAQSAGDSVKTIAIPGAEEQQTSYFVAPLDQSGDADLAQQFVDLVTGPDGQQALADAGFGKP